MKTLLPIEISRQAEEQTISAEQSQVKNEEPDEAEAEQWARKHLAEWLDAPCTFMKAQGRTWRELAENKGDKTMVNGKPSLPRAYLYALSSSANYEVWERTKAKVALEVIEEETRKEARGCIREALKIKELNTLKKIAGKIGMSVSCLQRIRSGNRHKVVSLEKCEELLARLKDDVLLKYRKYEFINNRNLRLEATDIGRGNKDFYIVCIDLIDSLRFWSLCSSQEQSLVWEKSLYPWLVVVAKTEEFYYFPVIARELSRAALSHEKFDGKQFRDICDLVERGICLTKTRWNPNVIDYTSNWYDHSKEKVLSLLLNNYAILLSENGGQKDQIKSLLTDAIGCFFFPAIGRTALHQADKLKDLEWATTILRLVLDKCDGKVPSNIQEDINDPSQWQFLKENNLFSSLSLQS